MLMLLFNLVLRINIFLRAIPLNDIYTDSQHKNPLCRVLPIGNAHENGTEEAFSYVKEKYREMILDAAETVLGYFWF